MKSIAEHVRNTSGFEGSVMAGVVNQLFKRASVATVGTGLRGTIGTWNGIAVAARLTVLGLQVLWIYMCSYMRVYVYID